MGDTTAAEHAQPPVVSLDNQPAVRPLSRTWFANRRLGPLGLLSLLGMVAAADYCLYQGAGGLSGWAAFLPAAAVCLGVGVGRCRLVAIAVGMFVLLLVTALRMVWQGNGGLIAAGIVQLAALTMALHGRHPWIDNLLLYLASLVPKGVVALPMAVLSSTGVSNLVTGQRLLNYGMPAAVCCSFIALFVYANPAAIAWCSELIDSALEGMWVWVLSVPVPQLLLWGMVIVLGLGAMTPVWSKWQLTHRRSVRVLESEPIVSKWYVPSRNLLWGVIATFAVYLICEFATLWFRDFPEGFYYSGYAHQGAAWLTLALLLTTLVLSAIFQGELLNDPRRMVLHNLAGAWSLLNYVLAVSVYHRMLIYVDFNGMTMMRMVGFFGISSVVLGFSLVLWKIHARRSFEWLIQRQLVVLVLVLFLLVLTPVDWIVYRINTSRVMRGELAPVVQVTEQRLSPEAWLSIWPLVDSPQPLIRDGVRAHLAELLEAQSSVQTSDRYPSSDTRGWQKLQISQWLLQRKLVENSELLSEFTDNAAARHAAMRRLREFAYQWY